MVPHVNQKRLTDSFLSLVRIDSPSYEERAMADEITRRFQKIGLPVEEDEAGRKLGGNAGNLIVRVPGTCALPPLLFCSHMDTVEPSRGKQPVVHDDGTITSAGDTVLGADDLAGAAAIIEAVTVILENDLPHRPLELVFPVAEECYTRGSHQLNVTSLQAREGYVFDLAGEPGCIALQAPTILYFKAAFHGRAAHAGECPENGIHAIQAAASAVAKTQNGHVDDVTTVNIGTIHGGAGVNIVPDSCVVEGEVRSFQHESALKRYAQIRETFDACAESYGAAAEHVHEIRTVAYRIPADHPAVLRMQRACGQLGLTMRPVITFGGSDGNTFNERNITTLVAANAMHEIHTCSEYTCVSELEKTAELVLSLMLSQD